MEQVEERPPVNLENADDNHPIRVLISEANSQDGKIYYSISTKSILPSYEPNRLYQVMRTHEEFLWLFNILKDDPQYNGILLPTIPRKPDFSFSQLISSHETSQPDWHSEEIKNEYVRLFARTVNTHNEFLSQLCNDERIRTDRSIHHFLTYDYTLNTGNSKLNSLRAFATGLLKSIDKKLLESSTQIANASEFDEEIEKNKVFFKGYASNLGNAITQGQTLVKLERENSLILNSLAVSLMSLETADYSKLSRFYGQLSSTIEFYRKQYIKSIETEDSYLLDTFKHFYDQTDLCLEILLKRMKLQQNLSSSQKNLDRSKVTGKDIPICQKIVEKHTEELESFTNILRKEFEKQSQQRISTFKNKFVGYCERQIKISSNIQNNLGKLIELIEAEDFE